MNFTSFLRGTAAAVLMAGAAQAEDITLTMSHYLPPVLGLHVDFLEPFARQIEEATDGKVKVEIQTAGSALGTITKQWDQVSDGIADISFGLHGIPRGRFACTQVIELPFLTDNVEEANEVLWSLYPDYLAAEHADVKVLALMAHDPGVLATTGGQRVEMPGDLAGLRIRVPSPYVAAMLKDLGAIPVGMPPGQVYENMQTGALDGVVLPWAGLKEFRITEVTTNAIEIGAYTTPFYFIMNQNKFDSLPAEVQDAIESISGDALVAQFPDWWTAWGAAGPAQIIDAGGEVISPDADLRQMWIDATAGTVRKLESNLAAECGNGAELIEKARALSAN
ncbi:TRAP transporter substrate-binding protein [Pseudophaeobacter sp.]|uniref:TRAP transporter substrate-binding protein n=1 Tax=Pseudophaeobacter sp. TaxID=1971739 RepID=UPI00329981D1